MVRKKTGGEEEEVVGWRREWKTVIGVSLSEPHTSGTAL